MSNQRNVHFKTAGIIGYNMHILDFVFMQALKVKKILIYR